MQKADIGIIGMAVMGQNLALNMESKGFTVAVYNRTVSKVDDLIQGRGKGKNLIGTYSLEEFVSSIKKPRKIMLMVKAGPPVDEFMEKLFPYLNKGDIIIDGGNSFFKDTIRRTRVCEGKGFLFIGTGVSGGEEGALKGPSIMPGGSPAAWAQVKPILQAIAAKAPDGSPCCDWIGPDGAGHYVKMVHNGIEYGDMQLICEAYSLMRDIVGLSAEELYAVFKEWNEGELNSYLIEITANIFAKKDDETGKPIIDVILDTAGQKGTGKWTSQSALDLGIPTPTIDEAVFARCISALKEERVNASKVLNGPHIKFDGDKSNFIKAIKNALYASKICAYAQGFSLLKAASNEYKWNLNLGRIALLWRAGCIIRARFLEHIKSAFDRDKDLANLLLDPYFKDVVTKNQDDWRFVVARSVE
ncbi:NADP-dependent phosphogluconate dehydrogenase, partial [Candidatus Calescamantes bacterium]|nr:NADP-dependent phosphogluconate dehydrogenase [Candidatus Calescamantes bacterium]